MARARNIKPGFFKNAELVELPVETRLLFIGLWTLADREGRMLDRPKQIKMELFPADSFDVDAMLNQLQSYGFIERYQLDNINYIQVTNFRKHQNPHREERASSIPAPCKHSASTVQALCEPDANTVGIGLIPDSLLLIPDSPIPEEKPSADGGTDLLWTIGLEYLGGERAFLGMLVKKHGRDAVEEAVEVCMANEVKDPKKYIVKVLNGKSRSAPQEHDEIEKAYAHFKWEQEMTNAA